MSRKRSNHLSISCIMPVFNGARYLAEAIDSILCQSRIPDEIVIVDDGSTDETPAIANSYNGKINYIRQNNMGVAAARNRGLDVATGHMMTFLDADDVWHQDKLLLQIAAFDKVPDLEMCLAHVQNFWIPELEEEAEQLKNHPFSKPVPGYVMGSFMARRNVFEKVGDFREEFIIGEDVDWFLKSREQNIRFEMLPEVLLYRRMHHNNISREEETSRRDTLLKIAKAAVERNRPSE